MSAVRLGSLGPPAELELVRLVSIPVRSGDCTMALSRGSVTRRSESDMPGCRGTMAGVDGACSGRRRSCYDAGPEASSNNNTLGKVGALMNCFDVACCLPPRPDGDLGHWYAVPSSASSVMMVVVVVLGLSDPFCLWPGVADVER